MIATDPRTKEDIIASLQRKQARLKELRLLRAKANKQRQLRPIKTRISTLERQINKLSTTIQAM